MTYVLYIMIIVAAFKVLSILWRIIQGKSEKREQISNGRYFKRRF